MIHAFDLGATRIAHCWVSNEQHYVMDLHADKKMSDEQFYASLFTYLQDRLEEGDYVFVEEPLVGRGGVKTAIRLSSVRGIIHLCAELAQASVYPVNVQTWKKEIVGKGNASKSDVAAWVKENHPHMTGSLDDLGKFKQDGIDAYCIALYGQGVVSLGREISRTGV